MDIFRKSLQKFYAKSIGGRDFSIMETVALGIRLPSVYPLLPVISLNTLGTRRLKTNSEMDRDGGGEDVPVSWESKIDKFDKRLLMVSLQYAKHGVAVVAEK